MKIKLIALIGLTLTIFTACTNTSPDIDTSIVEDTQALQTNYEPVPPSVPSFQLTAADGSIINLADLKGKKVFVNLWATWCPPCRVEMPSIEKLYKKVNKEKVAFVMLSLDENFELAKRFVKTNHLQLPVYYPAENLPAMFNTGAIPATFIFNEKGELIKANKGMDDYNTESYVQLLK
jgi:thiol-disulfide isomerase/thioredoxin